jgi:hypothetical protein
MNVSYVSSIAVVSLRLYFSTTRTGSVGVLVLLGWLVDMLNYNYGLNLKMIQNLQKTTLVTVELDKLTLPQHDIGKHCRRQKQQQFLKTIETL